MPCLASSEDSKVTPFTPGLLASTNLIWESRCPMFNSDANSFPSSLPFTVLFLGILGIHGSRKGDPTN